MRRKGENQRVKNYYNTTTAYFKSGQDTGNFEFCPDALGLNKPFKVVSPRRFFDETRI